MPFTTLFSDAVALKDALVSHRRTLHTIAETGFDLPKTIDYVMKTLQKEGIETRECGGCGLLAQISCANKEAPTVLLRADMDALPMEEESELPFAAENGNMHACGHDMHTAMLLGAATLLQKRREKLPCHVRLMFQGGEEVLGGAVRMLADGAAEGVDAAFMLHAMTACAYKTGTFLFPTAEKAAPEAAFFEITVQGKGGHGAMPEGSIDTMLAATETLPALYALRGGGITLTVGSLQAGRAANVLPDKAVLSGSLRSLKEGAVEEGLAKIDRAARSISAAYGARAVTEAGARCPFLKMDTALCRKMKDYFSTLFGEEAVKETEVPSNASEDFAFISQKCPTAMAAIVAGEREKGYTFPLHHPRARFDEEALPYGAAAYALFVFGFPF